MQLLFVTALALPAFVAAQGGYGFNPPASSSSSSSSSAAPLPSNIHLVMLGAGNSVTFSPSTVNAKANDTVVFQVSTQSTFQHGVVQSDPNSPCSELSGGLNTGLMKPGDSYAVTINTTQQLSFFCPQTQPAKHCEAAMVMIINPSNPSAITSLEAAASKVTNEATATSPQSSGSGIVQTAIPSQITASSGSGSGSGSGNSSGAIKGSVAVAATILTAVTGLFVTMA